MTASAARLQMERVSKRYTFSRERPRSFLDVFTGAFRRRQPREDFWAVRDLTLSVGAGEAVALIGANGAGKSTSLKLASRVIQPTSGTVTVNGSVSALLELAAGFHPDLTGRENVYLSGALLGLPRQEIDRRLDEIVDFSGVEAFIDSPVRLYSSGMTMRLGFSVASSVDPDILLIDEVLAVGDRVFAQRCVDRIYGLKSQGVAILFVSHDLESARNLCERAVLLEDGQPAMEGPTDAVIARYLRGLSVAGSGTGSEREERWGTHEASIDRIWLEDADGAETAGVGAGRPFTICVSYTRREPVPELVVGLSLRDGSGYLLCGPNTSFDGVPVPVVPEAGVVRYRVEQPPLQPGRYYLSASLYDGRLVHAYDHWEYAYAMDIYPDAEKRCIGLLSLAGQWEHRELSRGGEGGGGSVR